MLYKQWRQEDPCA